MRSRRRVHLIAGAGALVVFVLLLVLLRLRTWLPLLGAALTYLGLLWMWGAGRGRRPQALPEGVAEDDYRAAVGALDDACRELGRMATLAPPRDVPTVERMAALVAAIRRHIEANPAHVPRTRTFVRHTLGRIVAAVAGYVDLAGRAGSARDGRLAAVARQIEAFVPALERIDRACIENDLMALEINVEVLNEQLGSHRGI